MRPGVAAGHPATAEVGAEILTDGGTAADAVVVPSIWHEPFGRVIPESMALEEPHLCARSIL